MEGEGRAKFEISGFNVNPDVIPTLLIIDMSYSKVGSLLLQYQISHF